MGFEDNNLKNPYVDFQMVKNSELSRKVITCENNQKLRRDVLDACLGCYKFGSYENRKNVTSVIGFLKGCTIK